MRRSSSRERRVFEGGYAGPFVLRRERAARAATGGRRPRSAKRTPFTRPPLNRSWRPPDQRLVPDETRAQASEKEEATGTSEAVGFRALSEEDNASRRAPPGRRSENRVVKRGSPQPRSYRAAPSLPVDTSRVFGRARWARKETFRAYEHGAERLRDESDLRACAARLRTGSVVALGNGEARVLELDGFGVQTSIGRITGRDAHGSFQATPRTRAS